MHSYDIDGVIYLGPDEKGLAPRITDVIITGRSIEEEPETAKMLEEKCIFSEVFYNPLPFEYKTRNSSGHHKAETIRQLNEQGYGISIHWEDDPVQADIVQEMNPDIIVMVVRPVSGIPIVELENVRHT